MEPRIRALLTPAVSAEIAGRVGVAPIDLRPIGGFESFVFAAELRGKPAVVKATWSGRRSVEQIGAEQHFVTYVAERGASVCSPLQLPGGRWIASVPVEGGAFHVCAFERAPGAPLAKEAWDDLALERWGELLGRLHGLASGYPGAPAPLARPSWQVEYAEIRELLGSEPAFAARFAATLDEVARLPRTPGIFGPMHTDLHAGNLFWEGGSPRAFDFDDMLEFWFVSDLAIVLYYGLRQPPWSPQDRQADYERMRAALLRGYGRRHRLPDDALVFLPLFMSLREQTLRAVLLRSVPAAGRTERQERDLSEASERILAGRPALGLCL